ncbi:hypothetical protein BT96DRAFT_951641 [Gymnopus androsaceus JB14]|uniref:Uncharacterized protein n=1 Tax=Gymnopus androsaceus JB14 TaxID=1447944 RepID=A0A6A4GCF7_9AGAR|nr:hypothetical protein BT96DRAFT_951641 [Gymnopus androsaceus JB14]
MTFYTGMLGSLGARFKGQDSVDIFMTKPGALVRVRQKVHVVRQGRCAVTYERTIDGGTTWANVPALVHRIQWTDYGVSTPFDLAIAPYIPAASFCFLFLFSTAPPGRQVPVIVNIAGNIILAYRLNWYHTLRARQFVPVINSEGKECRERRPLWYHEHNPRADHHTEPTYKQGGKEYKFWCLEYGTQVSEYRAAKK